MIEQQKLQNIIYYENNLCQYLCNLFEFWMLHRIQLCLVVRNALSSIALSDDLLFGSHYLVFSDIHNAHNLLLDIQLFLVCTLILQATLCRPMRPVLSAVVAAMPATAYPHVRSSHHGKAFVITAIPVHPRLNSTKTHFFSTRDVNRIWWYPYPRQ